MKDFLGTAGEEYKYKIYYFLFIIFIFLFLFWSWIGKSSAREMIQFYILFGLFALFFILFDNLTFKKFDFIDSVTIEQPKIKFLSPKACFVISIIFSILLSLNIFFTKQAWVNYPKFQLFDSKFLNAVLSGVCGIVENLVFFSFLLPTTYAIMMKKTESVIYSSLISLAFVCLTFSLFHIFVYGTQPTALFSTVVFSSICSLTVLATRNMMIADALHFSNNLIAYYINAGVGLVLRL